jgi:CheY-like chemotaxis protein
MISDEHSAAPVEFVEQVKQALDNLYKFPVLQRLSLAQQLGTSQDGGESAAFQLRRELVHAIEVLNPGAQIAFRSSDGRLYNILNLYHIGRMTMKEVALEMGISERQAYRDLKDGQVAVAEILWSKYFTGVPEHPQQGLEGEIAHLKNQLQTVDVSDLLHTCLQSVDRLGELHSIHLDVQLPSEHAALTTNMTIAQQVITTILSYSIKQSPEGGVISVSLQPWQADLQLVIGYPGAADELNSHVILQLIEQLGWHLTSEPLEAEVTLTLHMVSLNASNPSLLVIDDNEGVIELITRYLMGTNCHLMASTQSLQGLEMARKARPDGILLDVMMPEIDGWKVLQYLRNYPETEEIPVIVCSVLHDPELAYSLGASYVIPKPVTQENILAALTTLKII